MEFREQNHPEENGIDSLIQWLKFLNIIKSTTDHDIYIKVIYDVTVSYHKVYTDYVLNASNNKTEFPELTIVFEEAFEIKFQEGYVLKYLHLLIFQSPLGFSVDQTYHVMELVN